MLLSNLYGLPVLRASNPSGTTVLPDALDTIFATVFAMTAEQVEKVVSGKTRSIVAVHGGHLLIQAGALHPLVLAIAAKPSADVDAILEFIPQLQRVLEPVRLKAEQLTAGVS